MSNRVKVIFEDMAINGDYEILEEGKDDDILREIAVKRGLVVPSKDLAIFRCKYAMVDKENRNKCTLPKKEVKKALKTLVGKAIDKDHLRKNTIGYWLDSELDGEDIVSYGAFWKSNFPEDYEEISKRMKNGKVKVSFEAWGERQFKGNTNSYDLTDIEFAGGALLFDTEPAFPDAEVLDFASKRQQILEFAKIIEEGKKKKRACGKCGKVVEVDEEGEQVCSYCKTPMTDVKLPDDRTNFEVTPLPNDPLKIGEEKVEEAQYNFYYDQNTIGRIMSEASCPSCEKKGWHDIQMIDFENSKMKTKCGFCGGTNMCDLSPTMKIVKKGKAPTSVGSQETDKKKEKGGLKEVDELLKKYNKASVEELVKFLDETLASLSSKETEIASLTAEKQSLAKEIEDSKLQLENSKLELEKIQVEAKAIKEQLEARVAAEQAAVIKAKRDELGEEFAKDMSDEDILNELKFENAKLKKELAKVKQEKGSVEPTKGEGLEAGQKSEDHKPEVFKKQTSIQEKAFGQ